ncbi:glycosyltransferase [Flavobacterium humi]|uniref:Glycosyltransferase n=1 Tax=Flavobacterium humi TaxID=2562683 RepID=A0A4Z0L9D6_9FLAO|nr:glycosyltransferase [Flavobacterium humi]TGD59154.1 glycosyltransferase [Flavobacterium humi]
MKNKTLTQKTRVTFDKEQNKINFPQGIPVAKKEEKPAEVLFISSFPPRECGIATYSQDLIKALENKFQKSFSIKRAALENGKHTYGAEIQYILETDNPKSYVKLAKKINEDPNIKIVLIQHEFGLFKSNEEDLMTLMSTVKKPIVVVFHTVLPQPGDSLKQMVQKIIFIAEAVIVMTHSASQLLIQDYKTPKEKISVIPHGTHLVEHTDKNILKEKYQVAGRKVLSTFGLLSSGKSIETSVEALQTIIKKHPDALFLIIGKTHPSVVKNEGEKYREALEAKVKELQLQDHVRFVNAYLPLQDLLEYLQLTDVYLFTAKDPNQAVSGTFSYAISCGCPIISTPIPHAKEVLKEDTGFIIDFGDSQQLAEKVIALLDDEQLRKEISSNGLHIMAPNAWENSAISHALLFEKINENIALEFKIPEINLNHFKKLTTSFGMIQFSVINQPDIASGYTLDDNARALVAMCQHYELTRDESDLEYILLYFNFIKHCLQPEGYFMNYVDESKKFTGQNNQTNLADANGRAIWALGYLISLSDILPEKLVAKAQKMMSKTLSNVNKIHSPRAMAFIIKGIYYSNRQNSSVENTLILKHLADRLVQMYKHESSQQWQWFEGYMTYANSILSEALLCAWMAIDDEKYLQIAKASFDFLLSKIFRNSHIKVISNKGWLHNGDEITTEKIGGEQPIDVAYTILALSRFSDVFKEDNYLDKLEIAFSWFLGKNHLNKIVYNPCTGGCYDGVEENYINLNQGAESTVSYLIARLAIEKARQNKEMPQKATAGHSKNQTKNQLITL